MDDKNYESWGWGWKKITGHLEFEDFGWIRPVQSSGMSLLRIVNTGSTSGQKAQPIPISNGQWKE